MESLKYKKTLKNFALLKYLPLGVPSLPFVRYCPFCLMELLKNNYHLHLHNIHI